jgi:serine/threonine protein kinase
LGHRQYPAERGGDDRRLTLMPIHPNNIHLINTIEALPALDGRFTNIRVVNCNLQTGVQRGCFSVVFRAEDLVEGTPVALKFYDLSANSLANGYRQAAFARESAILQLLLNADRCLQLVKALTPYVLDVIVPGQPSVQLPCAYFAVEWLDTQIDHFFLSQQAIDAVDKLLLFNNVVLAVEALHRREIFHRDLKADNLRATQRALKQLVVAIDLGTAARLDSAYTAQSYGGPVGAPAYAAPESIAGLTANRLVAAYTDIYAVGALLYELFNPDLFYVALRAVNPQFDLRLSAMTVAVTDKTDEAKQLVQWRAALTAFGRGISPVKIDGPGSTMPPAIAQLMNEALSLLTDVDYLRRRHGLELARRKTQIALRVLRNEREYQRRLELARRIRQEARDRARARDLRLAQRKRALPSC